MPRFYRSALGLAAVATAALPGCLPSYTFATGAPSDGGGDTTLEADATESSDAGADAGATGDASSDSPADSPSSPPADASVDAPVDSHSAPDASIGPFSVASAGAKVFATGFGQQLHAFYAQGDHRYWLLYADGTAGSIAASTSTDGVSWAATSSVSLGAFSVTDGNDFSVAYASLAGSDVLHIVANATSSGSPRLAALHLRGAISAGRIPTIQTVTLPDTTDNGAAGSGGDTCPQAGPSTVVAADGHVFDVTAWTGHPSTTCDTNIYRSTAVDNGTVWAPAFSHDGYYVSVPSYAFAHELVTLPDAGLVLAAWPDEDNQSVTLFDSIGWALSSSFTFDAGAIGTTGTFPTASAELFNSAGGTSSYDDWALCRLSDTDVHAVRHVMTSGSSIPNAFQELRYDGNAWQTVASPPAAVRSVSNTGVVLLGDGTPSHGMLLVTIGLDNAIDIAKWTTASGWTTLPSIPGTALRQSLSGSGCGATPPHVFWTEGSGPYTIMGADVSSLLGP